MAVIDFNSVRLGVKAKDLVTGFEGIVTAKVEYLTGCTQYGLTPPVKDGKVQSNEYFDEKRLQYVGEGINPADVADLENPGGVNRDAPKH